MITAAAGMWAGATIWIAWHSRRVFLGLPELIACRASYREDVTAVIPARNEAGKIGRAVRSLASQARVIVVDDHSTDATAAEAKAAGALVIPAPPLATCALGKPSACLAGAHAAKSRWILFVDADTWYEPNFVASLIDHAERHALDSASVFLRNDCQSWVERLLLPYAFGLYFCGVDVRRDPIANGQCLLFQTKAYWSIGG
ncbi:MAG: glycosyltransferase, partial [Acidobacteria bacterium]|nr:glycosyltransferase [Acidobacteriota bacterium]